MGYLTPEETQRLMSAGVDEDSLWLETQLDRIDPYRHEQGNDGATINALRALVLELRDKLEAMK